MLDESNFLEEISSYINKTRHCFQRNAITCDNVFENFDSYTLESVILDKIQTGNFASTTEQGDALETLVKSLFKRIQLVQSLEVTNKEITLGQIDIQLVPIEDEGLFDVWGLRKERPKNIIGECKNYSKKKERIGKPEIEKTCWRTCKGGCLSFFIAYGYTDDAIREIGFFNEHKEKVFLNYEGAIIVPLTVSMLELVIRNQINFCYFVKWSITMSKKMNITNYL